MIANKLSKYYHEEIALVRVTIQQSVLSDEEKTKLLKQLEPLEAKDLSTFESFYNEIVFAQASISSGMAGLYWRQMELHYNLLILNLLEDNLFQPAINILKDYPTIMQKTMHKLLMTIDLG